MSKLPEFTGERPLITLDRDHLNASSIVGFDKKDPRARPYNLLRTQLLKRISIDEGSLVGVTSSLPGAGKSFTSVNLAVSLAKLAKFNVALVDLDFRRGSVSSYLGLSPEQGVAEVLEGETSLESVIMQVEMPNFMVIPSLISWESGSTLLSSESFDRFLAAVRNLVGPGVAIIDLPPVFADDDAMIATQKLDGYVMIADCGITPSDSIKDSIERLKPATCLGSVLNRHEGSILDSYSYGYGYGYGDYPS